VSTRAPRVLALAAVLAALAGCGGSTTTVTVTAPAGTTAATSPPAADTLQATPAQQPERVLAEPDFLSPSGNIGCVIAGGVARCDIAHRTWSPPARPASCSTEVDYGQGLEVGSGRASVVCAGDTAMIPGSPRLSYGTASLVEGFLCLSRTSGMRCTNRSTGHGFFISIQSYLLF
jgi:hypothetical protein